MPYVKRESRHRGGRVEVEKCYTSSTKTKRQAAERTRQLVNSNLPEDIKIEISYEN